MSALISEQFATRWDAEHTFPFIEDENANITGYGHTDKAEFAADVNRYDELCSGETYSEGEQWTAATIVYKWAILLPDGERFTTLDINESTPAAFPITALWNQR